MRAGCTDSGDVVVTVMSDYHRECACEVDVVKVVSEVKAKLSV